MANQSLLLTNRELKDLNPLVAGEEACAPGHSFGPAVRKYTLIHYVLQGKGTFYARGGVHPVHAGQAFVILPGEVTTYRADQEDPWYYQWIGFDGELSGDFSRLPPVLTFPETIFGRMMQLSRHPDAAEYLLAGELFSLYAHLFSPANGQSPHVRRVENYIRSNYMHPIRVEQLARELNLDRRYLSRLFREQTGTSIQDFLIQVRMDEAERLLLQGYSVKEAAQLSGYEDVSNFSRMYKKLRASSPGSVKPKKRT